MAAGLGFKTFTTGDVLTAGDTNGYLMQGVWVFDDAAARTSAVASPEEGNMSFLKDTNSTEYYDGAAWVAVGAAPAGGASYTLLNAGGTALTGTTVTISGLTGYDQLQLLVEDARMTSALSSMTIRINTDTGTNYFWLGQVNNTPTSYTVASNFTAGGAIGLTSLGFSTTGDAANTIRGGVSISAANSTGIKAIDFVSGVSGNGNGLWSNRSAKGVYSGTSVISSVSFIGNSAFNSGTVYVYGSVN